MTRSLSLIFMGAPAFAVPTLQSLIDSKHQVVAVYTQPPRPANRGKKETPSPVQMLAEKHGIPVHAPVSITDAAEQKIFAAYKADAAIVAAYGLLLPKPILDAPRLGFINVHPSKLPRWRGAAPIQRTIMAGDTETAICIMRMNEGLDTGDVLLQEDYVIPGGMTTGELHDLLAAEAGPIVLRTLEGLQAGTIKATPQAAEGVTYAKKISKEEARIDWSLPAKTIYHQILGLNPYPGAYFVYRGENIKTLDADLYPGHFKDSYFTGSMPPPGTVMDDRLTVLCGEGAIAATTLQRAGKTPLSAPEFLRGFSIPPGTSLANRH